MSNYTKILKKSDAEFKKYKNYEYFNIKNDLNIIKDSIENTKTI